MEFRGLGFRVQQLRIEQSLVELSPWEKPTHPIPLNVRSNTLIIV